MCRIVIDTYGGLDVECASAGIDLSTTLTPQGVRTCDKKTVTMAETQGQTPGRSVVTVDKNLNEGGIVGKSVVPVTENEGLIDDTSMVTVVENEGRTGCTSAVAAAMNAGWTGDKNVAIMAEKERRTGGKSVPEGKGKMGTAAEILANEMTDDLDTKKMLATFEDFLQAEVNMRDSNAKEDNSVSPAPGDDTATPKTNPTFEDAKMQKARSSGAGMKVPPSCQYGLGHGGHSHFLIESDLMRVVTPLVL